MLRDMLRVPIVPDKPIFFDDDFSHSHIVVHCKTYSKICKIEAIIMYTFLMDWNTLIALLRKYASILVALPFVILAIIYIILRIIFP